MLQASGVDVPEPLTGAALDAAFALQFWIASSVAIPNHSRVRWVETLKEFARARYRDLPFNFLIQDRLGKIAKSAGEDATMECLRLWKVDTSEEKVTLSCLMVDTEPLASATCPNCLLMMSGSLMTPGLRMPKSLLRATPTAPSASRAACSSRTWTARTQAGSGMPITSLSPWLPAQPPSANRRPV